MGDQKGQITFASSQDAGLEDSWRSTDEPVQLEAGTLTLDTVSAGTRSAIINLASHVFSALAKSDPAFATEEAIAQVVEAAVRLGIDNEEFVSASLKPTNSKVCVVDASAHQGA